MRREFHQDLNIWFRQENRKPLILRGARQVGKTTSVRIFAREQGLTLIEVNMEDPQLFISLIKNNNPIEIFEILALERNISLLHPDKMVIFFDEAQECPAIIPFLRYCFERAKEFAVICAGSLLEFTLAEASSSFPVGRVEYLYLGPMTFEEYLLANSKQKLLEQILSTDFDNIITSPIHDLLDIQFREYLLCGGMPEAVKIKSEKGSLVMLEKVKSSILESYYSDFPKYKKYTHLRPDIDTLQSIFEKLPMQIGNKIKYVKLVENTKAEKVKRGISFLEKALIASLSYHTSASKPPLKALKNEKWFKLFFLDVGLVQSQLGLSIENIKSQPEINHIAKGALAEQFIAQHLLQYRPSFLKPELFHWSRNTKGSEAEVDFMIEFDGQIIPIEVKAGTSRTMRSLIMLQKEKKFPLAVRFYSGLPKIETLSLTEVDDFFEYQLLSLPHYLVGQLSRIFTILTKPNYPNAV